MAGAASAHQAATASREQTSHQRAVRTRRSSADPQRAQQGATAAAADAPAALQALSRLQQLANASPQVAQLRRLQGLADNRFAPVAQLAGAPEEEELIQGQFATAQPQPQLQQAPRANNTGLPDQLKSGIESLSGLSMDHVRVHYNSAQPAQLNALAYAQGSDIHLAPGQERHLPHEAWHVVQQAQGRVRPTLQLQGGVPVNDDAGLEREADVMGIKALERGHRADETHRPVSMPIETAQQIEGSTTNSPDVNVASDNTVPLTNGKGGTAQRQSTGTSLVSPLCVLLEQLQTIGGASLNAGRRLQPLPVANNILQAMVQSRSHESSPYIEKEEQLQGKPTPAPGIAEFQGDLEVETLTQLRTLRHKSNAVFPTETVDQLKTFSLFKGIPNLGANFLCNKKSPFQLVKKINMKSVAGDEKDRRTDGDIKELGNCVNDIIAQGTPNEIIDAIGDLEISIKHRTDDYKKWQGQKNADPVKQASHLFRIDAENSLYLRLMEKRQKHLNDNKQNKSPKPVADDEGFITVTAKKKKPKK
jgi:hypothetical protein